MIVQKSPVGDFRYLEVVKNRFSGDLGKIPYRFDPDVCKYYELTKREKEATLSKKGEQGPTTPIQEVILVIVPEK